MARPTKLTEERLQLIRQAVRLGLSNDDAARAVGVTERTWYNWKSTARKVSSLLDDGGWRRRKIDELRQMAEALGLDESTIEGTGTGGRVVKRDLGAAVMAKARRFLQFLQELRDAEPYAKAALLGLLERLARGGPLMIDPETGRPRGLRKTRTVTERRRVERTLPAEEGMEARTVQVWEPTSQIEIVEERESAPNRMAIVRMLELRWPEEFGRRKALDPKDAKDPQSKAMQVAEAVMAMFSTVPPAPELPPGEDLDDDG